MRLGTPPPGPRPGHPSLTAPKAVIGQPRGSARRPTNLAPALALIALATLAGCTKKPSETASSTSSDTLIASNPLEKPSGNLTPRFPMEQPTTPQAAPRPQRPAARERAPQPTSATHNAPASTARAPESPGVNLTWGSFLHVGFTAEISSETAHPGDAWTGTLKDSVFANDRLAFPAGCVVHGTVKDVKPAEKGDRAMLALEVTSIECGGRSFPVNAAADPIVAESPRVRNVGAVAGGAAAGALIGRAVGGGKGGLIGGLLGGAAAGGAVAKSKGYQVVVKPGSTQTFTVSQDAVVRPAP